MKKKFLFVTILLFTSILCGSWGFFAHQRINQLAIYTLPPGMIRFYKSNTKYITTHAIDPDKRRYADPLEAPRHYLDVEHYEKDIDSIPKKYKDALLKYGLAHLNKNGIVSWQIERTYYNLVKAFKEMDSMAVLHYSADLGHYIGDAHVPLHTTSNHNGQLTNQTGLHAFWESRLPELFSTSYNFLVGKARYYEDPLAEAWKIVKQSHIMVDTVLLFEASLNRSFPSDKKYAYSERNNLVIKQYSEAYSLAYQNAINNMVEKRMQATILSIGCFWYSAWIDAGQPDLKKLKKREDVLLQRAMQLAEDKYKEGKIIGRDP